MFVVAVTLHLLNLQAGRHGYAKWISGRATELRLEVFTSYKLTFYLLTYLFIHSTHSLYQFKCRQGRLSLSTVGDKWAKDNFFEGGVGGY